MTNYRAISIMFMAILGLIETIKIVIYSKLHQGDNCDYYQRSKNTHCLKLAVMKLLHMGQVFNTNISLSDNFLQSL
jgi:hypothetical protein